MKQDNIFNSSPVQEDFTFNEKVAEVFDDMLDRSVPFYKTVIDSIIVLIKRLALPGATVYDLGCSTGSLLLEISRRLPEMDLELIGVDNAAPMLEKARLKAEIYSKTDKVRFLEKDITSFDPANADVIICNYTLQFIRPILRRDFIKRLYNALPAGGILIISEKVINHEPRLNREFIELYHEFKRQQGYTELEIAAKREALENILIPFSIEENHALLRENGFPSVETFFQWFNFCSFIAIK